MKQSQKPLEPVRPDGMEILFFYQCPFCSRHVSIISPVAPQMLICDSCGRSFPIVPVDERSLHYIHIMLAGGKAAMDSEFL